MIFDWIINNWKVKLSFGFIVLFIGIVNVLFILFIMKTISIIGIVCMCFGGYWIDIALSDKREEFLE